MRKNLSFAVLAGGSGMQRFDEPRVSQASRLSHARHSGIIVRSSGERLWMH
jgi:hypothetical protein